MSRKYSCEVCGYIYDPEFGCEDNDVEPGTQFQDIDEVSYMCPVCGSDKHFFTYNDNEE